MSHMLPSLAALALMLLATPVPAQTPSAQEIVAASDRVRNPDQPFRLTNTLVEYVKMQPRDRIVLTIFAREDKESGRYGNLVRYAEPPRDVGKMVLLNGSSL